MSAVRKGKKEKRKAVDPWKMKNWYEVYAPRSFKEAFIGIIPSGDPDSLNGRVIETLMYDISGKIQQTHIKLKFKIVKVVGNRCITRFYGHEYTRDSIRGLVNRGTSCINGIFNFTTTDGFKYRVSSIIITKKRAKRSQQHTIRKIIYDVLNEYSKNNEHEKFIRGIIYGKYADNIKKIAQNIYPLRKCEVFKTKVIGFPADVEDRDIGEPEEEEEVDLELKEHGKSIRAKKQKKHKEEGETESETQEPDLEVSQEEAEEANK